MIRDGPVAWSGITGGEDYFAGGALESSFFSVRSPSWLVLELG